MNRIGDCAGHAVWNRHEIFFTAATASKTTQFWAALPRALTVRSPRRHCRSLVLYFFSTQIPSHDVSKEIQIAKFPKPTDWLQLARHSKKLF